MLLIAEEIDALLVLYIPVDVSLKSRILEGISAGVVAGRAAGGEAKPVLLSLMVADGSNQPLPAAHEHIPSYTFPEATARVLGKVAYYAEWRNQPLGMLLEYDDTNPPAARTICQQALAARGPGWLATAETRQLLLAMGLPVAPGRVAQSAEEAIQLAREADFPVALKLASHVIVHKTEMGGIFLNLQDETQVRQAFASLRDRLARDGQLAAFEGALVQPMVSGGVEVMVGGTTDPLFGPLIAFGLDGIHVEILGDVCFRITPLTNRDAIEMVRSIRGYRLLEGYRNHPPADVPALEEVLLRISR